MPSSILEFKRNLLQFKCELLDIAGKLMVLSLTAPNRKSVSVVDGISLRDHRYEMDSGYLQTLLVQVLILLHLRHDQRH